MREEGNAVPAPKLELLGVKPGQGMAVSFLGHEIGAVEVTEADITALSGHLHEFLGTLNPGEQGVLAQLYERAAAAQHVEVQGYYWWIDPRGWSPPAASQPSYQPHYGYQAPQPINIGFRPGAGIVGCSGGCIG
jgi:hypothetical protein